MSAIFKGISFPFTKKGKQLPASSEDEDLIKQSIIQIIMTERGSRIFRPNFGTDIMNFIFENTDLVKAQVVKADILQALTQYEPRIVVKAIELDIKDTTLMVLIKYVILSTQELQALELGFPIPSEV